MCIELDKAIDIILCYLESFAKPENLLLIILIGVTVLMPLLVYYFHRRNIPKLVFDGVWKQNAHYSIDYFLKVKRDNGEGKAEGVKGFVGIKSNLLKKPLESIIVFDNAI